MDPNTRKFIRPIHYDFLTPEYKVPKSIKRKKWETCRGIGTSFGYNKYETAEDYLTGEELIHLLIDMVSKNGNLLINVGPKADGTIPKLQKKVLLELGSWLDENCEAIFSTRPWKHAEGSTKDGLSLRFTKKNNIVYIITLGHPQKKEIKIELKEFNSISDVRLLGLDQDLSWKFINNYLIISIPSTVKKSPALSFKIR